MATAVINPSNSIKCGKTSATDNWATIQAAASSNDTDSSGNTRVAQTRYSSDAPIRAIYRNFFNFSINIPASATILTATLSLYGSSSGGTVTRSYRIYNSGHGDTLDANTYNDGGTTQHSDTAIAHNSWNTSGYNDYALNSVGITALQSAIGGVYRVCFREHSYDVGNTQPPDTVGVNPFIAFYSEDNASNKPILTINYTTPSSGNPAFFSGGGLTIL